MPRVSIIVPNYNHEKFLVQRLETILGQTFSDFEVLLLDDASTDDSLEIFLQYSADPRFRIILNNVNSGTPFKQWNKGLDEAVGEYIWIAESDDFSAPGFLQELVGALDADTNAGLAYCQSCIVHSAASNSKPTPITGWYAEFEDNERWNTGFRNSGRDELAKYMVYKNIILNASAVVFRKSLLNDGLRAPENMRLTGDWMFWVQLLNRTDLVFVEKPLNFFRREHSQSQRSKMGRQGLEFIEGLDVYKYIEEVGLVDQISKESHLRRQVKLWGEFASKRRLTWKTNWNIYNKLLQVHPEVAQRRYRSVLLPFVFYFAFTPLKSVRPLVLIYRRVRSAMNRYARGASHA